VDTFVLQDLTTIQGTDTSASIPQSTSGWLELPEHEDLVFYTDVRGTTGTVAISFETAPSRLEQGFVAMIGPITLSGAAVRVDKALFATAVVPVAQFVRWHLTGSGTPWGATFRVVIAAYSYE
jgi:hypothetical protein